MHRNLGFYYKRCKPRTIVLSTYGKRWWVYKGRDKVSFWASIQKYHWYDFSFNCNVPVAVGYGLASKLKKQKRVILSFTGDGSTSEGDFHEAVNLAAVWQLPVIFLIENNGYGLSTPSKEQFKCKKLSDKAIGYGIKGLTIDGNDVLEVYKTITNIAKELRNGGGPVIVEALTFRMRGHEEASGTKYYPAGLQDKWKKKDPILKLETEAIKKNI